MPFLIISLVPFRSCHDSKYWNRKVYLFPKTYGRGQILQLVVLALTGSYFKKVSLMQIGVLHAYWVPPWIPVGNGPLGLLLAWSVPGNLTKAGCFVSLAKLQFLIMMLLCSIMVRGSQMLLGLKTTSSDRTSVKIVLYFPLLRQTSLQRAQTSPNTSLRFLHLQYLHPHPSLLKSYVKSFKF